VLIEVSLSHYTEDFYMKKHFNVFYKTGLILFLSAILLSSCVPMKRIRYIQDPKEKTEARTDFKKPLGPEYIVHKGKCP
jgi:hypothetical protein